MIQGAHRQSIAVLQQLPFISSLYSATTSASIAGKLFGFVLGVGIVEEATKALPIWWLYLHKRNPDSLNTIVFLGCVSGFAFGIAEATKYSISYALGLSYGRLGFGDYLILQLARLITLPLLHAMWAGIFAYFIALGSVNRHVEKGLLLSMSSEVGGQRAAHNRAGPWCQPSTMSTYL
jgi:RsiW-degrading membrane proteinase PrsW (M82 family)